MAGKPTQKMAAPNKGRTPKSRATRARLVDTAIKMLAQNGYAGSTTQQIAAETGVTRGPLQYYFPEKQDLMVAVAETIIESRLEPEIEEFKQLKSPHDRLRQMLQLTFEQHGSAHQMAAVELVMAMRFSDGLRKALAPFASQLQAAPAAQLMTELMKDEQPQEKLLALAQLIRATLQGLALEKGKAGRPAFTAPVLDMLERMVARELGYDAPTPESTSEA